MALWRWRRRRTGDTRAQFEVELGSVRQSTVAIGDNIAINTPCGSRLIRTVGSEVLPEPRLRRVPVLQRPERAEPLFGRAWEVASAGQAGPGAPFQVHGPDGVGKSALLAHVVFSVPQREEGVVHAKVRRRGVYDIQAQLFRAFWECEVRFTPAPEEMSEFLGQRRALVVLDDVGLDRSDLEVLIDTSPGSTFVIGSEEQTLWRGRAERLAGLDIEAALELVELRLGRPLAADERVPAAAVARALEGHPQRIIEAVAVVREGSTSFEALARGSTWDLVGEASNVEGLSEAQGRILAVLRAAGAPLGSDRIAQFADVADAARELAALESGGWVRSASPRYRLARALPPSDGEFSEEELFRRLGEWAERRATPEEVAEEVEVIERALEGATDPRAKMALARAAEGKLALAGMLDSWGRVLNAGLGASQSPHDEAYMLHQLGTRAGLLGQDRPAIEYLERALELRVDIGEQEGAEVTRHNLQQLRGEGTNGFERDGGDGRGPGPRPKWSVLAAVVIAALAVGAGIYAVAKDGDPGPKNGSSADGVKPPDPPPTGPPAVRVREPTRGAQYSEGEEVRAAYACVAARDAELRSCRGTVPIDSPINTKEGRHVFRVMAKDSAGRQKKVTIRYSVSSAPAPPAEDDEIKPTIRLKSPSDGAVYGVGSPVRASFACVDNRGGSGVDSCTGDVENRERIDTSPGLHSFTVMAVDKVGNPNRKTVTYRVERAPDTTRPTITITTPVDNFTYDQFATVQADYSCSDRGGSGLDSCQGSAGMGQPIDTARPGTKSFTVTAKDGADNPAEMVVSYNVKEAD